MNEVEDTIRRVKRKFMLMKIYEGVILAVFMYAVFSVINELFI